MGESAGGTERRETPFTELPGNWDLNPIFLQRRKFQDDKI